MRVMFFKIPNAFDSHCHFLATGQVASGLSLKNLKSADDIKNLKIETQHFQNQWLVGFGWDQNEWEDPKFPLKKTLDDVFSSHPVFFSRADGHASWINTMAISELKKLGYDFVTDPIGGKISKDLNGEPSGLLFDQAHIKALSLLPSYSPEQIKNFIFKAQKIFNSGGFTHVRDLSMTWQLWQLLAEMVIKKELTVCIESFVTVENINDFDRVFQEIQMMKNNPSSQLRIKGVKLFLDGSLGSKTAYISKNYLDSNTNTNSNGLLAWNLNDIKKIIQQTWQNGLELAVHTIGDEAAHQVVLQAREISASGLLGRLHLEHVQILRPETIQLMKPLHLVCHMQPCHWLTDHKWLSKVLPSELLKDSFPWEALRRNKIPIQFGSDSPIEPTSLIVNRLALVQSATLGVPEFKSDWMMSHQHSDLSWTNSWTEFTDEKILQVFFDGKPLI